MQFRLQNWKLWFQRLSKSIQITLISGPPLSFKKSNSSLITVGVNSREILKSLTNCLNIETMDVEIENIQDREHKLIVCLSIC